jgi:signal transduction histidine kinase
MNNIYFTLELQKKLDQIKELQDRIAQAEVYSLMGQMVGTVSHQLKTPLAILNNSNEILLQEKLTKKEKNEVLQTINEEISHLNEIVNKFLNFVKTKKYKLEEVDLNKIIENVIRKNHFDKEKIEITGSINEIIISNENALEEIFVIILQNGFDAISGISDGRIRIKIENMILSISDNGTKLDKNIEKIFEPFYTTKAKGIGLGLAIVSKLSDLLKIRLEVKQKKIWKYFTLYWGNS